MRLIRFLVILLAMSAAAAAQNRENWLNGVWEGTGYQIDSNQTWTMKLTVSDRGYSVEYPSLKCNGTWRLVSLDSDKATFIERISTGKENCQDDGNVVVELLNHNQIAFRYSYPGSAEVVASAVLGKRPRR